MTLCGLSACVAAVALSGGAGGRPSGDSVPAPRVGASADRWLGADKARHALLAGFTYAIGFSAARLGGLDRRASLGAAVGPVVVVSIGKEVRDRRAGGRFSVRDLAADAIGAAAYAAILARTAR